MTSICLGRRVIVSGSLDHTVRVWCRAQGVSLTTLSDHSDWVTRVHLHDNNILHTLGLDNMIHSYKMVYPNEFEDFDSKADAYKINNAARLNSNNQRTLRMQCLTLNIFRIVSKNYMLGYLVKRLKDRCQ